MTNSIINVVKKKITLDVLINEYKSALLAFTKSRGSKNSLLWCFNIGAWVLDNGFYK